MQLVFLGIVFLVIVILLALKRPLYQAILGALIAAALAFGYQVAGIFGVVPPVAQDELTQAAFLLVNILVALGVVVDPTTQGVGDSARALEYTEPKGE